MIKDKKTGEPYINIWFGNFYRPAYDNKEFVKENIALLKKLGFNSVLLDSKAWEDFRERFQGKEASPYVSMQEYMQQELKKAGMSHEFLALYLNGDNLYPNIRFSPPIYGESVIDADGNDGKHYRYWSKKAKTSMEEHIAGLIKTYSENMATIFYKGKERKIICSMWDPIVAPSFDEEGKQRYLHWLSKQYQNDITLFNEAYHVSKQDFTTLEKEDYWFSCKYPGELTFSEEDIKKKTPKARILMDNRKWQCEELCLYFKDMKERLYSIENNFYLCPDMAQWGYFLNIDGSMLENVGFADLWDTAARGIDIYHLAPYVDCANFISVPVTPDGDADIYVTSCHHNMMRNINQGREFIGGIYFGRFLYNDIYSIISPCETIASIVASGAQGYTSYGVCGLDDGGLLHRMGKSFHDSLQLGNEWLKQVLPKLGTKKPAEIAILFPSSMAAYETMHTNGNKERRLDLLGWYKACCDLGIETDIIDSENLCKNHLLDHYKVLILPDDDCYGMNPNLIFETVLKSWCEQGGILFYGPNCTLIENCFHIKALKHCPDAFYYQEAGMVKNQSFCTYPNGKTIASYLSDGLPCITEYQIKKGYQYAFGFSYGYAYNTKFIPHVPLEQKNNELYPLEMMKENIFANILKSVTGIKLEQQQKGIEKSYFTKGEIIINHTSYPYYIQQEGEKLYQYPINDSLLLPHSAVLIEYPDKS